MSTSLLKKSLRLFEDEPKSDRLNGQKQRPGKGKRTNTTGKSSGVKKQASLKDRKVKSAIDVFVKKHLKQDKTSENLLLLEKIQRQSVVTQESANRIFSYQLKKTNKAIEKPTLKKKESTVFTEEDFLKFEQEYFVKT